MSQLVQLQLNHILQVAQFPFNDYLLDCAELGLTSGWLDDCVIEIAEFHRRRFDHSRDVRNHCTLTVRRRRLLSTTALSTKLLLRLNDTTLTASIGGLGTVFLLDIYCFEDSDLGEATVLERESTDNLQLDKSQRIWSIGTARWSSWWRK